MKCISQLLVYCILQIFSNLYGVPEIKKIQTTTKPSFPVNYIVIEIVTYSILSLNW